MFPWVKNGLQGRKVLIPADTLLKHNDTKHALLSTDYMFNDSHDYVTTVLKTKDLKTIVNRVYLLDQIICSSLLRRVF